MGLGLLLLLPGGAAAQTLPDGEALAQRINERPRASQARRLMRLVLIDSKTEKRERNILSFWKLEPDARKLVLFALSPPDLKNSAFLAIDWFDSGRADEQWVYRPKRRRAKRIGDPNRSDSFLGSDFTLEDVKKEDRVEIGEFRWKTLTRGTFAGRPVFQLEQVPATPELAKHLGYARLLNTVDAERFLRLKLEFFDEAGKPTKTVELPEVRQIDGFWSAARIEARTHEPPHRSVLLFDEVDYASPVPDEIFTVRTLEREQAESLARKR